MYRITLISVPVDRSAGKGADQQGEERPKPDHPQREELISDGERICSVPAPWSQFILSLQKKGLMIIIFHFFSQLLKDFLDFKIY